MPSNDNPRTIKYGDKTIPLALPPGAIESWLEPVCPPPPSDPASLIRHALNHPFGGVSLQALAKGKRSAAILIPGKDRIAGISTLLPLLLQELNDAGIPDEAITVTIARGTHVRHSPHDIAAIMGPEATSRVRWQEHRPEPGAHLTQIGVTRYGTPVELDKSVVEADIKILTGRIIPHYFAGFGGGRKALVPGVSSFSTILSNHRRTLAAHSGIHPAVRACSLRDNPVHLDMLDAAQQIPGTFVVNTLLDTNHSIVAVVAGELDAAHTAGCRLAAQYHQLTLDHPMDAVITCSGGWPYDCDFVQALKAAFDAQDILRPGGAMLWIAQCPQGMKEGFLRWAEIASESELNAKVRSHYNLAGHNSIMLRSLTRRSQVALWSDLPEAHVRALGIEPVHTLNQGLEWLSQLCHKDFHCAALPFANVTHATLR